MMATNGLEVLHGQLFRLKKAIDEALDALYDQSVSLCPRVERARTILEQVAGRNESRNSGDGEAG